MDLLKCKEILKATGGRLVQGDIETVFSGISTDSRKTAPGDLFIPIAGERFDGHDFIGNAFEAGAKGSLTHKTITRENGGVIIEVDNTLWALGSIAGYYRSKFDLPVIAVTGSVGKTSTKDMIACVLSGGFKVLRTEGNFNNEIGLPLTLLNLEHSHTAAVVEMGMSGFNEISRLSKMARPHFAVITNIGSSHIGKLGSKENILKAKLEVLEGLVKGGTVVLNADDELLAQLSGKLPYKTVLYGLTGDADYRAYDIRTGERSLCFKTRIKKTEYEVVLNVPGIHNASNAMAAIAVGVEMGLDPESIVEGFSHFKPERLRLNFIECGGIMIINDAYNASPESMRSAIDVLKEVKALRKIAVLGDMLELGQWAPRAHFDVGKFAAEAGIDHIIAVGSNAVDIAEGAAAAGVSAEILIFEDVEKAAEFVASLAREGDGVLVKGSRGMQMERIVDKIKKKVEK